MKVVYRRQIRNEFASFVDKWDDNGVPLSILDGELEVSFDLQIQFEALSCRTEVELEVYSEFEPEDSIGALAGARFNFSDAEGGKIALTASGTHRLISIHRTERPRVKIKYRDVESEREWINKFAEEAGRELLTEGGASFIPFEWLKHVEMVQGASHLVSSHRGKPVPRISQLIRWGYLEKAESQYVENVYQDPSSHDSYVDATDYAKAVALFVHGIEATNPQFVDDADPEELVPRVEGETALPSADGLSPEERFNTVPPEPGVLNQACVDVFEMREIMTQLKDVPELLAVITKALMVVGNAVKAGGSNGAKVQGDQGQTRSTEAPIPENLSPSDRLRALSRQRAMGIGDGEM